jgi:hypothetical protein
MKKTTWVCTCIVIVSVLTTTLGYACPVNTTIRVTATDGTNIGYHEFAINIADAGDWFEWTLDGEENIVGDNGDLLGSIEYLKLKVIKDPAVSLEFYITAGNAATTFTIDTNGPTTFDPIANPEAYASVGITLTDRNQNGAAITGLYDDKIYQAVYNGLSVYANMVDSFTAGVRKTVTRSEYKPETGDTEIIGDTLSSIDASFKFILSAKDSAAGTSYFEVLPVPEPATVALLGLGVLSLIHRRNR